MYAEGRDPTGKHSLDDQPADLPHFAGCHPLRLAILTLLAGRPHGGYAFADLCVELPGTPAAAIVEYHLEVLGNIGLICRCDSDPDTVTSLA